MADAPKDLERFDITDFGESLVQRARDTRERSFKRQRKEAWKLGLIKGGVNLMNRALQKRADDFLMGEEAMAIKGRYRSAAHQAQRIIGMQQQAQQEGKTMQQYFFDNVYLPQVTAEFSSTHGEKFKPESYMPKLREKAWELAQKEALEFEEAIHVAHQVPDWETAQQSINNIISPPRSAGEALVGKITGMFRKTTPEQIQEEIMEEIDREGWVRTRTYQQSFDKVLSDRGLDEARAFVKEIAEEDLDPEGRIVWQSQIVDVTSTGQVQVVQTAMHQDGEGNVVPLNHVTGGQDVRTIELTGPVRSIAEAESIRMDMIKHLNIWEAVDSTLEPPAAEAFYQTLAEEGIDRSNFTEPGNFEKVSQLYSRLRTSEGNVRDNVREQIYADTLSSLLNLQSVDIMAAYQNGGSAGLVELLSGFSEIINAIQFNNGGDNNVFDFNDLDDDQ